jgi:hypothetical protein
MSSRLQVVQNERNWVGIGDGRLIYILVAKRDEFDRIALPLTDHGVTENGHVLSKALEKDGVYIVFQHWLLERTIETIRADNEKRRALAETVASA